jgi:divalent metal cation (Fe/Co/Zn/Cd) transporter
MTASSDRVVHAALAGNALVAATKFVAAWWTGSSAMLSEALHSCVDTVIAMFIKPQTAASCGRLVQQRYGAGRAG